MPSEPAASPIVTLHAAGSLRRAFGEILPLFEQVHAGRVEALFGPAGLLRERIEARPAPNVFASASLPLAAHSASGSIRASTGTVRSTI